MDKFIDFMKQETSSPYGRTQLARTYRMELSFIVRIKELFLLTINLETSLALTKCKIYKFKLIIRIIMVKKKI